jgi:GTPase SAR1 family protein
MQRISELVAGNRNRLTIDRLKTAGLLAAGAIAIVGAAFARHPLPVAILGGGAVTCGLTAEALDRRVQKQGRLADSLEAITLEAIARTYQQALSPQQIQQAILPSAEPGPLPMDRWWGDVLEARLLLICGPQGSGKTSLALRLLADRASQGHQIQVLDPHAAKGQWPYPTIGAGKDYRAIDKAIQDWIAAVEGYYRTIAQDANAPTPTPQTLLAEELTQWADEVESAPKMIRVACSDIRKAKRYLVAVSHGRTLATIGGAKGYRNTIDNAAMVIELDRAADELGASTGRLYRPGNPEPVAIAIERFPALPQPTAKAITPVQHQDDRALLNRCWEQPAIEVGHETIAENPIKPTAGQQELLDLLVRISQQKGAISAADCQRASRKFKALTPDQIRQLFLVAQAIGLGAIEGVDAGARFTAYPAPR